MVIVLFAKAIANHEIVANPLVETETYLDAYGRIKALGGMQRGFAGFVNNKPY